MCTLQPNEPIANKNLDAESSLDEANIGAKSTSDPNILDTLSLAQILQVELSTLPRNRAELKAFVLNALEQKRHKETNV